MLSTHSKLFAAALGALALCSGTAHAAASQVYAEISGFTIELIDLDPNDQITPWLNFTSDYQGARTRGSYVWPFEEDTLIGYGTTAIVRPTAGAGTSLSETALSAGAYISSSKYGPQQYQAEATRYAQFILSPSTGLLLTASGTVRAEGFDLAWPRDSMRAGISLHGQLNSPVAGIDGSDYIERSYSTTGGVRDYSLSAYFASGAVAQSGNFQLGVSSSTDISSTVPEPSSYAMLLAGAVLLGGAARKRRRA